LANRVLFMDGGRILPELATSTVMDEPLK
jgi:hypothetical protein